MQRRILQDGSFSLRQDGGFNLRQDDGLTWDCMVWAATFASGLQGTIGYTIYRPSGAIFAPRSTLGVSYIGSSYVAMVALPFSGAFVVSWDAAGKTEEQFIPEYFVEPISAAYPNGITSIQAMQAILSILAGKTSNGGLTFYSLDGQTIRLTGTVSGGDRTGSALVPSS